MNKTQKAYIRQSRRNINVWMRRWWRLVGQHNGDVPEEVERAFDLPFIDRRDQYYRWALRKLRRVGRKHNL